MAVCTGHSAFFRRCEGFTLIEIILVIVIIGILSGIALQSVGVVTETARSEETMQEMERLAYAIAGNPNLYAAGMRTDYGYVGDVGSLPPNWDALVANPGGFASWNGPYTADEFTGGGADRTFKLDAWGEEYSSPSSVVFSSTGGPDVITRRIAATSDDLLNNSATIVLTNAELIPPGETYKDSLYCLLRYPDGAGDYITDSLHPSSDGRVNFFGLPIGAHLLRTIYIPGNDTITREIHIDPGTNYYGEILLASAGWHGSGGGKLVKIAGSDSLLSDCQGFSLWITNTGTSAVDVTSMVLSWTSPTAYYRYIRWSGVVVFNENNPKAGSGELAVLSPSITILPGQSGKIEFDGFMESPTGGAGTEIANSALDLAFSDGSIIAAATGSCP
jgi:prepilin-type N-terminal cleavage/methylation domain-containing protein